MQKWLRNVAVKLLVKPSYQPAGFSTILRSPADHGIGGDGLFNILRNGDRIYERDIAFGIAHYWRPSGWVHL